MLVCLIFKDLLLERAVGMSEVCVELVGKLVGEMLGLSKEELSPSDNLISLGLGSLDIMRIAGLLTKNGCNVTFSELVSNPCMASWVNFARERSARSSSNGSPLLGSANYSCLLRRFCYTVPRSTATAFHGRLPRSNAGCSDCEGRASAPLGQYGRLCS